MVNLLRMGDSEQHQTNLEYMEAIKKRAYGAGVLLLFADEDTFIQALLAAGFLEYQEVKSCSEE